MRRLLCLCVLLISIDAFALVPELRVQKGNGAVALELLDVSVTATIRGQLARTEFELTYRNPEASDLRGDFLFPLPDDATVSDVGLYFNERLRHSVVVERERARTVYDDVVHNRRVDPALAEWMEGNTFRLDVYPIPANGEKKIYIRYEQDLSSRDSSWTYKLDLRYGKKLRSLKVEVDAEEDSRLEGLPLKKDGNASVWSGEWHNEQANGLLELTTAPQRTPVAMIETDSEGFSYFSLQAHPAVTDDHVPETQNILLFWDVSGSNAVAAKSRALLDFLHSFIERQKTAVDVRVVPFHTHTEPAKWVRSIQGAQGWSRLQGVLQELAPIGGTDLKNVLERISDMAKNFGSDSRVILVTDGMDSWNSPQALKDTALVEANQRKPLLILSAAETRNTVLLRKLADSTHGWYFDLAIQAPVAGLVDSAMHAPFQVSLQALPPGVTECNLQVRENGWLRISGKSDSAIRAGVVKIGIVSGEKESVQEIAFGIRVFGDGREMVRGSWARARLETLLRLPSDQSAAFVNLGRNYHLATPNTSLLVLDSWRDYERYGIEMPPDVIQERDLEMNPARKRSVAPSVGANAVQGKVVDDKGAPLPGVSVTLNSASLAQSATTDSSGHFLFRNLPAGAYSLNYSIEGFTEVRQEDIRLSENSLALADITLKPALSEEFTVIGEVPVIDAQRTGNLSREYQDDVPSSRDPWAVIDQTGVDSDRYNTAANESGAQAELAPAEPSLTHFDYDGVSAVRIATDVPGTFEKDIAGFQEGMAQEELIRHYLQLRDRYRKLKRFYVLTAQAAGEHKDLATRILSDAVEFSGPDTGLLRTVARELLRRNDDKGAMALLQRATVMAPHEPQNLRDLALLYAQLGRNKEAEALLRQILQDGLAPDYGGLADIVADELNRLSAAGNRPVDLEIEKNVDLKVTASWDVNFTDIDLHVIEPSGEEVFYSHPSSKTGATLSADNTSGYGPEIYRSTRAVSGKFKIYLSYYRQDNTAANGDATATVTVQQRNAKGEITKTVYPVILQQNKETIEVATIRM